MLGRMKALIRQAAERMTPHGQYVRRHCPARAAPILEEQT
jgi:hypothetical protein